MVHVYTLALVLLLTHLRQRDVCGFRRPRVVHLNPDAWRSVTTHASGFTTKHAPLPSVA